MAYHLFGLLVPYDQTTNRALSTGISESVDAKAVALNGDFCELDVDHDRHPIAANTPGAQAIDFINGHSGLFVNIRLAPPAWHRMMTHRAQWRGLSIDFQTTPDNVEYGQYNHRRGQRTLTYLGYISRVSLCIEKSPYYDTWVEPDFASGVTRMIREERAYWRGLFGATPYQPRTRQAAWSTQAGVRTSLMSDAERDRAFRHSFGCSRQEFRRQLTAA
jgi:hypothetical protein